MADIDSPKLTKKHDVKPPPSIAPATEVLPPKVGVTAGGVSTELPPSPDIEDLGTYIDTQQANIKKSVMNLSDPAMWRNAEPAAFQADAVDRPQVS